MKAGLFRMYKAPLVAALHQETFARTVMGQSAFSAPLKPRQNWDSAWRMAVGSPKP
jgi:hypothetical protein